MTAAPAAKSLGRAEGAVFTAGAGDTGGVRLLQHVARHVERQLVLLINAHPGVAHEIHSVPEASDKTSNVTRNGHTSCITSHASRVTNQ